MPLNWMDVKQLPLEALLLFERVQLAWLPGNAHEQPLAIALPHHPAVEWTMRHKCPEIAPWLDKVLARPEAKGEHSPEEIRAAEITLLRDLNDWLVYAIDPAIYDAQPFNGWDSRELTSLVDFRRKTVIDVGSGTGRQAFVAAETAALVWAVEPVQNLRDYMRQKARERGLHNFYTVDGLITAIPFPDSFADIVTSGHAYGDEPQRELDELCRVAKPGGMVILCPGNNDMDNEAHRTLVAAGFEWAAFEEPRDGMKRKYWRRVP